MAKRPVKKKAAPADRKMDKVPSASVVKPVSKCKGVDPHSGKKSTDCSKRPVYMRRNRKTGEQEHYCAVHWKRDVEGPHAEKYKDHRPAAVKKKVRVAKKAAKKSTMKKVVKK